jgi:hypothetical protein
MNTEESFASYISWARANLDGWLASGDEWFEVARSSDDRPVRFVVRDDEWSNFVRSVQLDYAPRDGVDQLFNSINDRVYECLYGGVRRWNSYALLDGDFQPSPEEGLSRGQPD